MAIHAFQNGQLSRPAPRTAQSSRFPAPNRGIDTRVSLTEGSPEYCVYTYNLCPFEYGLQVRQGYREWQIGIDNGAGAGVHTIIPFDGIEEQGVDDRLFAVTNEGIWDVTTYAAAPVLKTTFLDQNTNAGYGVYAHYVGNDESNILFYADNFNGLFSYDPVADTWAQTTGIEGPVIENIRFIVLHKQRLWLIEENSTYAWYLPVGSIAGTATKFYFGSKMKHGGNLEGLFNWTVDGGDGVDDYLVAVSRSGDVLPYRGDDPSDANTWSLVGTYFIGEVPRGPHIGSEHGGELFLLSSFGLASMNDLLQGAGFTRNNLSSDASASAPVTALLRDEMKKTIDDYGWAVRSIPSEGAMLVSTPKKESQRYIQLYFNVVMRGWGLWRDVPVEAFDSWNNYVVIGTADNRVMLMDITVDDATITPPEEGTNGEPIEFSILTSFQNLGQDTLFKHASLVRPDFLSEAEPTYNIQVKYDYNITEPQIATAPPFLGGDVWDVGLWDEALWSTTEQENFSDVRGGWDYGRYVAIAMIGKARNKTRLIGWDVVYTVGGPLI